MIEEKLEGIDPGLSSRQYLQLGGLLVMAFVAGFLVAEQLQNQHERLDIDEELNASQSLVTVEFYSNSVDFMMERGEEAQFYLDRDRDGSADERMDVERDGEVHQDVMLLDHPDNIYRVFYRYKISDEEAWMQFFRVEPLKPVN